MSLREHLNNLTTDEKNEFAIRCGTSVGFLRLVAYGVRSCSPELAVAIDRESNGKIDCRLLCPIEKMDWEYLSKRILSWG